MSHYDDLDAGILHEMNPILEEVWRIKDELTQESGDDLHQFCENTRHWAVAHPHRAPGLDNAEELRAYLMALDATTPALREEPPPFGTNPT